MKTQHRKTFPALTALAGLLLGFSAVDRAGADSFVEAASMRYPRAFHTATLLRDGKVLVAEGIGGIPGGTGEPEKLKSAKIYDPTTESWSLTRPKKLPPSSSANWSGWLVGNGPGISCSGFCWCAGDPGFGLQAL